MVSVRAKNDSTHRLRCQKYCREKKEEEMTKCLHRKGKLRVYIFDRLWHVFVSFLETRLLFLPRGVGRVIGWRSGRGRGVGGWEGEVERGWGVLWGTSPHNTVYIVDPSSKNNVLMNKRKCRGSMYLNDPNTRSWALTLSSVENLNRLQYLLWLQRINYQRT